MTKFAHSIYIAFLSFTFIRCGTSNQNFSHPDFGIATQKSYPSLFKSIAKAKGSLNIDVYDFKSNNQDERQIWQGYIQDAINAWLKPIKAWTLPVTPNFSYTKAKEESEVVGCQKGVTWDNIWECSNPDDLKIILDPSCESSYASFGGMYVVLCQRAISGDNNSYKALLHELGHTFGLNDLYQSDTEKVYETPAIMNDYLEVDGLQEDDKTAIVTLYGYLFEDGPRCPESWTKITEGQNEFCIKN